MVVVMNRFSIKNEFLDEFITRWKDRPSNLAKVDGFIEFKLLKEKAMPHGKNSDENKSDEKADFTLVSSFVKWESMEKFMAWTTSDEFKDSHKKAHETEHMHHANAKLEIFEVLDIE